MIERAKCLLLLTYLCLSPPLAVNGRVRRPACRDEALELLERYSRGPQDPDQAPPDADCLYDVGANVTLLHEGVRRDLSYGTISMLLAHGANIGVRDPAGATPLHWAAQHCARAATGALCAALRRGGQLDQVFDIRDVAGLTALDEAEMAGCVGVAMLLAQLGARAARFHGDEDCQRELVNAVLHGDAAALNSGLAGSRHADCTVAQHPWSWSLLHLATAAADFAPSGAGEAMLSVLLAHGADASNLDRKGQSPLFLAVAADRHQLAASLLKASPAALHHQDYQQRTPLHHAALLGALSVVKLLLRHGARLDGRDVASKTPLDYAIEEGHPAIAALLTPRDPKNEMDFKLPPNGGCVEGCAFGGDESGDGHVVLGGVLGGVASIILACAALCCARRRRPKVAMEDIGPPRVIVDPISSDKPYPAIHDTKESIGPQLGAIANTRLEQPQPPMVKKRLKFSRKKRKDSEKNSEAALSIDEDIGQTPVVEAFPLSIDEDVGPAQVVEFGSPGPPSPRRHSHSPASQRRARERTERRSRSQIYSTRIAVLS